MMLALTFIALKVGAMRAESTKELDKVSVDALTSQHQARPTTPCQDQNGGGPFTGPQGKERNAKGGVMQRQPTDLSSQIGPGNTSDLIANHSIDKEEPIPNPYMENVDLNESKVVTFDKDVQQVFEGLPPPLEIIVEGQCVCTFKANHKLIANKVGNLQKWGVIIYIPKYNMSTDVIDSWVDNKLVRDLKGYHKVDKGNHQVCLLCDLMQDIGVHPIPEYQTIKSGSFMGCKP